MSTFVRLANLGLVQAFQFDATAQRFIPVDVEVLSGVVNPWFLDVSSTKE